MDVSLKYQVLSDDQITAVPNESVESADESEGFKTAFSTLQDDMTPERCLEMDEWDLATNKVIAAHKERVQLQPTESSTPNISLQQATEDFRMSSKRALHQEGIKTEIELTGLAACLHLVFGPPRLKHQLLDDRDLIFTLANWPFENENRVHFQILQTLYKKITNTNKDVARFGDHWDDLGFQGNDPSTDLRGGGCLSLLNLLYLTTSSKLSKFCRELYNLSRDVTQNFPFAVVSVNMTGLALQALREKRLNKEANTRNDIITVLHEFYVGCFLHLYLIWKNEHKTIADSGFVIRDTENHCKNNVSECIRNIDSYLRGELTAGGPANGGEVLTFHKMEEMV